MSRNIRSLRNVTIAMSDISVNNRIKFRENLPNSQKFRGPTQSGRSQGSQR